jgi:hypothetical protein
MIFIIKFFVFIVLDAYLLQYFYMRKAKHSALMLFVYTGRPAALSHKLIIRTGFKFFPKTWKLFLYYTKYNACHKIESTYKYNLTS